MFQVATGWLGWSAEQALHTPIPQIELAVEGRVEWAKKTNPFGGGEPEKPKEDRGDVGERLKRAFRALGAKRG